MSKIIVARSAGFCHGVKRAVEKVFAIANNNDLKNTVTLGPVVHNPQVLEQLDRVGIKSISTPEEAVNKNVVVRAHGITPQLRKTLRANKAKLSDATCPDVGYVHGIVKKHATQGYSTVVIGDKNHAEIQGVLGFTNNNGYVVDTVDEVKNLPDLDKVCVVTQTTHQMSHFKSVCDALEKRFGKSNCAIFDTICQSTKDRQEAVEELASDVDIMVVIGGKNSANTHQLVNLSKSKGAKALHVSTLDDLNGVDLSKYAKIGVTAGASTPNWMVKHVVLKIQKQQREKLPAIFRFLSNIWDFVRYSHMLTGLAACSLCIAFCSVLNVPASVAVCAIPFFFITDLYMLNSILRKPFLKLNEPPKLQFYKNNKFLINIFLCVYGVLTAILSYLIGYMALVTMMVVFIVASIVYKIGVPWKRNKRLKMWSINKLPGSKDGIVLCAWIVPSLVLPLLSQEQISATHFFEIIVCIAFAVPMVFIRSVMDDTQQMHEDLMVGAETLPMVISEYTIFRAITISLIIASILLLLGFLLGWISLLGIVLLIPLWGSYFLAKNITKIQISLYIRFCDLVDLIFVTMGVVCVIVTSLKQ